jgi:hypothetical protein
MRAWPTRRTGGVSKPGQGLTSSSSVERFVYDPSAAPGPGPNRGVLLEDPADLKILRELRPRLRGSDYGYIPVRADLDAADGGSNASYDGPAGVHLHPGAIDERRG